MSLYVASADRLTVDVDSKRLHSEARMYSVESEVSRHTLRVVLPVVVQGCLLINLNRLNQQMKFARREVRVQRSVVLKLAEHYL